MTQVIESFAAYGESLYPGGVVPREHPDRHSDGAWQSAPCSQADPTTLAGAAMTTRASVASPVSRLWSWIRREREVRRAVVMLRTLDDRTLLDLGIHRSQIEGVVRHGRFCGF
ncbi:MAG: DUF1127 domain-containing protein [Mycobacterium sp.]|nr:DUF1127 domain-containing protein [Mycobacterium sp.]